MAQPRTSDEKPDPIKSVSDLTGFLHQFKLPGIDVAAIMESRRKDIDALVAANQTALQGIQNLGQTQAEILKKTMTELQMFVQEISNSGKAPENLGKVSQLVQQAVQKTLTDMRELAEAGYKAQADTFAVVSKRAQENIQEIKALVKPK